MKKIKLAKTIGILEERNNNLEQNISNLKIYIQKVQKLLNAISLSSNEDMLFFEDNAPKLYKELLNECPEIKKTT